MSENDLPDGYQVHHSIPQKYSDLFEGSDVNIHDNANLRGVSQSVHQEVTNEWTSWSADNSDPTAEQVLDFASEIDVSYGDFFIFPGE